MPTTKLSSLKKETVTSPETTSDISKENITHNVKEILDRNEILEEELFKLKNEDNFEEIKKKCIILFNSWIYEEKLYIKSIYQINKLSIEELNEKIKLLSFINIKKVKPSIIFNIMILDYEEIKDKINILRKLENINIENINWKNIYDFFWFKLDKLKLLINEIWVTNFDILLNFKQIKEIDKLGVNNLNSILDILNTKFNYKKEHWFKYYDIIKIISFTEENYNTRDNFSYIKNRFNNLENKLILLNKIWVKNMSELIDFKYFIEFNNILIFEEIINEAIEKYTNYKDIKNHILKWNFKYKDLSEEDYNTLTKYKKGRTNNIYTDTENTPFLSLTDIDVDESDILNIKVKEEKYKPELSWTQIKEKRISLKDWRNLWNINNISTTWEEQLHIFRLLWSIFPIAPILRIHSKNNNKVEYASIDIWKWDKTWEWKEITWLNAPTKLINFMRVLYQFLAMDFDRHEWYNHNFEDNIIYDIDLIFKRWVHFQEESSYYSSIFNKPIFYPEFKKLFFLIKNYVHNNCVDELKKYKKNELEIKKLIENTNISSSKDNLEKNLKQYKKLLWKIYLYYPWIENTDKYLKKIKTEDLEIPEIEKIKEWMKEYSKMLEKNRIITEKVLSREAILSMKNFVRSLWIKNKRILEFAETSDKEMF